MIRMGRIMISSARENMRKPNILLRILLFHKKYKSVHHKMDTSFYGGKYERRMERF